MNPDLFTDSTASEPWLEELCAGAMLLHGFALAAQAALLAALDDIIRVAPFRHMVTPGGFRMSVAMSNCGVYGWVSDRRGYRYDRTDLQTGQAWPAMPDSFKALAQAAADSAGFTGFEADACLINRYIPGARMALHQDKDERDFSQPIVSVSLGLPAVFLFGGMQRSDKPLRVPLLNGDVVVWGGAARLRYHGVMPIRQKRPVLPGGQRINLTFRKAC